MHAADGSSAEAADALRTTLTAMTVCASKAPLQTSQHARASDVKRVPQASVKAQLLHSVTYPGDTTRCVGSPAAAAREAAPRSVR